MNRLWDFNLRDNTEKFSIAYVFAEVMVNLDDRNRDKIEYKTYKEKNEQNTVE